MHAVSLHIDDRMAESTVRFDRKTTITRSKFTAEEDAQIVLLVQQYGTDNWVKLAGLLGTNRTKRQVRERWQSYLDPQLDRGYTEAEDTQLEKLFAELGPQWARIAAVIGNKSAISARNRYRTVQTLKAKGLTPDYSRREPPPPGVTGEEMIQFCDFDLGSPDPFMTDGSIFTFDSFFI
jgi:hypothetical protein